MGGEKGPRPIVVKATALTLYSSLRLRFVRTKLVVVAFNVMLEWNADPLPFTWI